MSIIDVTVFLRTRPTVPMREENDSDLGVLPVLISDDVPHLDRLAGSRPYVTELLQSYIGASFLHFRRNVVAALDMRFGSRLSRTERTLFDQVRPSSILAERLLFALSGSLRSPYSQTDR